ncbi:ABC-F family ATP-binding cassette domain-containing protein [Streptomyces californicus]
MRKELAWLRRGAPACTSKPQYRIEAANELIADVPPPRQHQRADEVRQRPPRQDRVRPGGRDRPGRAQDPPHPPHLAARPRRPHRSRRRQRRGQDLALLRALAEAARTQGEEQPAAGKIVVGKTVRLAYLSQEVHELNPNLRVLEAVQQVRDRVDLGKGREMTQPAVCEQFGFTKEKQWTPVSDLSGGERRWLQILRLLMHEPNVLFLDEPTNDLDIETLTQLEDLLDGGRDR